MVGFHNPGNALTVLAWKRNIVVAAVSVALVTLIIFTVSQEVLFSLIYILPLLWWIAIPQISAVLIVRRLSKQDVAASTWKLGGAKGACWAIFGGITGGILPPFGASHLQGSAFIAAFSVLALGAATAAVSVWSRLRRRGHVVMVALLLLAGVVLTSYFG